MEVPMPIGVCSGCLQEVELTRYRRCSACVTARKMKWHYANADRAKETGRALYHLKKACHIQHIRDWKKACPAEHKKLTNKISGHRYRERAIEQHMLKRARKRGMEVNITLEDIVIPEFCPVLGLKLTRNIGQKTGGRNSPSLDRIDNTRGYVKGNVIVVSLRANRLKNDATVEELQKIVDFYKQLTSA